MASTRPARISTSWAGLGGGYFPATPNAAKVARIIKTAAARVGLDAKNLAGHSLRAGYVTEAIKNGADVLQVMEQTGHRSMETVRGYFRAAGLGARRATFAAFGVAGK